ncbi:MAG TPA: hypothetical protein P5210_13755 [Draconibacterium sp.]|nr:hypothetical protein [Draconibacterium sp.]
MKKLALFILILTISGCNDALPELELIEIDRNVRETYYDDAVELYIREILDNPNHFNYSNPNLDETELNKIL